MCPRQIELSPRGKDSGACKGASKNYIDPGVPPASHTSQTQGPGAGLSSFTNTCWLFPPSSLRSCLLSFNSSESPGLLLPLDD